MSEGPRAKRPGFPVKLAANSGAPTAVKSNTPARTAQTNVIQARNTQVGLQKPLPSGVGLDSQTVRSRMVDKLASKACKTPRCWRPWAWWSGIVL